MLELLNNPISTCSQKVRLCLHEKGLRFTDTKIDFRKKEHLTADYLKLNPNGVVPTLLHNNRPIIDSSVIVEYLEDVFPELRLSPVDPYERATMRAWLRYIEEVPTAAIRVPSFNKVFVRHYKDMDESALQANADDRPLRKHFYKEMGASGFSEDKSQASIERLAETIDRLDRALGKSEWIAGEALTLADYCVVPTIDRMSDLGMAHLWKGHQHFQRWWAAIQSRPAFEATYYRGSRVSDLYPDLKEPV